MFNAEQRKSSECLKASYLTKEKVSTYYLRVRVRKCAADFFVYCSLVPRTGVTQFSPKYVVYMNKNIHKCRFRVYIDIINKIPDEGSYLGGNIPSATSLFPDGYDFFI